MISSSVRRAALNASPAPIVSSFTNSLPRAATAHTLSYRSHQRRFSSSKPSSPADGSKDVDGVVARAHSGASSSSEKTEKKPRSSKKKSKEDGASLRTKGKHEPANNLPSVPSTQHIAAGHICSADFFSLYRPISLTSSLPKAVTEEAFAAIFTSRTRANGRPLEVISTLTNTLDKLDAATGNMKKLSIDTQQDQWNEETDELRASITAESFQKGDSDIQHLDGTAEDSIINFPKHVLTGKYRPFHPPPAPVPMNTLESLTAGAEAVEAQEPQQRMYTSVLTIKESTDVNGDVTYVAHTSPLIVADPASTPTRFLERMKIRQERYREQRADENEMIAISVKRQRKLKMKKHKYKKLMRKTRNLRRKLDRN